MEQNLPPHQLQKKYILVYLGIIKGVPMKTPALHLGSSFCPSKSEVFVKPLRSQFVFGWSHEVSRQKRGEKNQEQKQQQQQQHDGFKHVSLTRHLVGLLDSPFQEPQAFADLGRCIVAGMFFEWESMECLMEFMFIIINNNNNIIIINQNKSSSIINGKLSTRKATHRNEKKLPLDLWGHDPDSCIFPILIGLFPVTVKMLHVVTPKKGWRLYILVAEYSKKQTNAGDLPRW